jgi:hypothetical protein
MKTQLFAILMLLNMINSTSSAVGLLVEAESFRQKGGWVVDQQFVHSMGSPYLLAHGNGWPVADAVTRAAISTRGQYHVWVRTKNWVPGNWNAPGVFNLLLNDVKCDTVFGTKTGWGWQYGGRINLQTDSITLKLHDLTGFEGRCDAIYLTTDANEVPTNQEPALSTWRNQLTLNGKLPVIMPKYDVVVVGGGIAGTAAAVAAARGGAKVALIQDRPVLGGNCSNDVRVHTLGDVGYKIVSEINANGLSSGTDAVFTFTDRRQKVVNKESNITQYYNMRAYGVNKSGNRILSVDAKHIETGEEKRFIADQFIDCTGDGWIGFWAGARYMIGREATEVFNESLAPAVADNKMMGSTVWWNSVVDTVNSTFPAVPWAMPVSKTYSATTGDWWWEYGIGLDPFLDAEHIRDHLFRATYGSFYTAKQKTANAKRKIYWMGYIMGKRESRRIVGDYIITESDIRTAKKFPDVIGFETRTIDLHYVKDTVYDWQTEAQFTTIPKWFIPYRSLISADIENLMMAGRDISQSHVALGSPRVMNTCGQMGVATGYAAALCKKYNTTPKGVYLNYLQELQDSVGVPKEFILPTNAVVVDNSDTLSVVTEGFWVPSTYSKACYGANYLHDNNAEKGLKWVKYTPDLPSNGRYKIYVRHIASSNRSSSVPFQLLNETLDTTVYVNQTKNDGVWVEIGSYSLPQGKKTTVTVSNNGTTGFVIADAVAFVLIDATGINSTKQNDLVINTFQNNGEALVRFNLPYQSDVKAELFDLSGKKLTTFANGIYSAGIQAFPIDKTLLRQSSVYFIRVNVGGTVKCCKFIHT